MTKTEEQLQEAGLTQSHLDAKELGVAETVLWLRKQSGVAYSAGNDKEAERLRSTAVLIAKALLSLYKKEAERHYTDFVEPLAYPLRQFETDKEQAWLDGLKVGDAVAVIGREGIEAIRQVENVTPGRRFTVLGTDYRKDGSEIGEDLFYSRQLIEPTKERRLELHHRVVLSRLRAIYRRLEAAYLLGQGSCSHDDKAMGGFHDD